MKDQTRISDAVATDDERTVHASVELKSTETEIKSHRCPICYQTMLMPKRAPNILMPCGHTFCNACLNARDDPRCRTCGDRWRHRVPNHQLQTTIQAYVDATATAAASFEDSVIWTSADRGSPVASSSFDAALARAHVRCEQLRERMREGEAAQTAALEREHVAARHLRVLQCDEDNARARLAEVARELREAHAAVEAQRAVCVRIANEVRTHGSSVTSAGEALAALERGRERLVAEAEGSADGRTKPATLPGTHTAVSSR